MMPVSVFLQWNLGWFFVRLTSANSVDILTPVRVVSKPPTETFPLKSILVEYQKQLYISTLCYCRKWSQNNGLPAVTMPFDWQGDCWQILEISKDYAQSSGTKNSDVETSTSKTLKLIWRNNWQHYLSFYISCLVDVCFGFQN